MESKDDSLGRYHHLGALLTLVLMVDIMTQPKFFGFFLLFVFSSAGRAERHACRNFEF